MPGQAISVRLDADAAAALRLLESAGMTRSQAIRHGLLTAARERSHGLALAEEVAELARDEADQQEKAAIAAALDEISDPW